VCEYVCVVCDVDVLVCVDLVYGCCMMFFGIV